MKNVHPIVWGVLASILYWVLIVFAGLVFGFPGVILFIVLTFLMIIGGILGFVYNDQKNN